MTIKSNAPSGGVHVSASAQINSIRSQSMPLPRESLPRPGEHTRTGVDDRDFRVRKFAPAFQEKPPVAFAQNQNILRRRDAIEKGRAAPLKFVPRRDEFHPAIMRRENIKAHERLPRKTAVPPEPGQDAAHKINHHIPRITRRAPHQMRADHFKKNRPKNGIKRYLTPRRRGVVRAQTQPALHQQQRRQGARHQEHIVEMKPQESIVDVRLDAPAIQRVQRTGNQKQTVTKIPKLFHSKAMIVKPKAAARSSL